MLCLFQVLSTVQQTIVSWALSVRKAASWHNSLLQKFGNSMLYCLAFKLLVPIQRFHCVLVSICGGCSRFKKSWMNPVVILKVRQLRNLTLIVLIKTPKFVNQIQIMINNNLSKSIRSIARDVGMSEFLIRQVVHKDIWYFSYKISNIQFLS